YLICSILSQVSSSSKFFYILLSYVFFAFFFFFNDTATTEIYTLSLHDALPISKTLGISVPAVKSRLLRARLKLRHKLNRYFRQGDRKSTRLNSSHVSISYAVFCLKKKKNKKKPNNKSHK